MMICKDNSSGGRRRWRMLVSLAWLFVLLGLGQAHAAVSFRSTVSGVRGLPPGFSPVCWDKEPMFWNGRPGAVVAGFWESDGKSRTCVVFLSRDKGGLTAETLLDEPALREEMTSADGRKHILYSITVDEIGHGDFNGDGIDEVLLVAGPLSIRMIIRQRGQVTVKPIRVKNPLKYAESLQWFDYDGDGRVDLLMSGWRTTKGDTVERRTTVYRNVIGGIEPMEIELSKWGSRVLVLDFDQDGKMDILMGDVFGPAQEPKAMPLLLNRGGKFQRLPKPLENLNRGGMDLIGLQDARIAEADFDGDGLKDILVSGHLSAKLGERSMVSFAYKKYFDGKRQQFRLRYDRERTSQLPEIHGRFIVRDLDGDGDEDLIASGHGRSRRYSLKILENRKGVLREIPLPASVLGGRRSVDGVIPFDVNSDGLIDLICCHRAEAGGKLMVLINTSRKGGEKASSAKAASGDSTPQQQRARPSAK